MSSSILRYKADYRTLVFVAAYFVIAYGGFIAYMTTTLSWPVTIAWIILTCLSSFSCAVIVHNTIHSPIFHKKSHNKFFQYILSLSYGYSVSAYVPGHNFSHHKDTQTAKDNMRTSKLRFKWHLLNQLFFFFVVTPDLIKAEQKFVAKMKNDKVDWYRQWRREMILVHAVRIGILFVCFPAAVLFIWLPHIYAAWGIVGTNLWQHDGCDMEDKYNHSRTFTGGFINYFLFNNGYHGAHHDRPSMHWSLLPAYHEKIIAPHIHPNLNLDNMLTYMFKAYIYPGKRLNYDGSPYIMEDAVPDIDWVAELSVIDKAHKYDFGAEEGSIDDILQTTAIQETETSDIV